MGNNSSSGTRNPHEDSVDYGKLTPQGVYTGPQDWNHTVVTRLIVERRLAPFYKPLDDYHESWTEEQILLARKSSPESEHGQSSDDQDTALVNGTRQTSTHGSGTSHSAVNKKSAASRDSERNPEAEIYRNALECPICFLVGCNADHFNPALI